MAQPQEYWTYLRIGPWGPTPESGLRGGFETTSKLLEDAIIQNVHICVVDSERLTRDFIVDVMTYCVNRQVFAFESANDLMTYLRDGDTVHLILSEIHLPDQNGIALLEYIKREHPQTFFIAMSANPGDQAVAQASGADVFLAKPFVLQDLFAIVQRYVVGEADTSECGTHHSS